MEEADWPGFSPWSSGVELISSETMQTEDRGGSPKPAELRAPGQEKGAGTSRDVPYNADNGGKVMAREPQGRMRRGRKREGAGAQAEASLAAPQGLGSWQRQGKEIMKTQRRQTSLKGCLGVLTAPGNPVLLARARCSAPTSTECQAWGDAQR